MFDRRASAKQKQQQCAQRNPCFDLTDHHSRQLKLGPGLSRLTTHRAPVCRREETALMRREGQQNPWLQAQAHCARTSQAVQARWQDCFQNAQRSLSQAVESSQSFLQHTAEASAQQLRNVALAANRPSHGPAFAVSMAAQTYPARHVEARIHPPYCCVAVFISGLGNSGS